MAEEQEGSELRKKFEDFYELLEKRLAEYDCEALDVLEEAIETLLGLVHECALTEEKPNWFECLLKETAQSLEKWAGA